MLVNSLHMKTLLHVKAFDFFSFLYNAVWYL